MAFTLHWPNVYSERYTAIHQQPVERTFDERLSTLTSALSLQGDVLFPNGFASICNSSNEEDAADTPGCVGNLLDNPFPLEPRIEVTLPLVQYPSKANGPSFEDMDMCSLPVLNWENYVMSLKAMARRTSIHLRTSRRKDKGQQVHAKVKLGKYALSSNKDIETTEEEAIGQNDVTSGEDVNHVTSEEDELLQQIPDPNSSFRILNHGKVKEVKKKLIRKCDANLKPKSKVVSFKKVVETLYGNQADLEVNECEQIEKNKALTQAKKCLLTSQGVKIKLPKTRHATPVNVRNTLKKFKDQPHLKVMGTWNYLYSGTGACGWINDSRSKTNRNLFVGNGAKLRMITVKKSKASQMLSYSLESVWEEDEVPSNKSPDTKNSNEPLSDLIFEIRTCGQKNLVGVRRGRSIEVYQMLDLPTLIASIPNICYEKEDYIGFKPSRSPQKNPLLISFDLNQILPSKIVTIDENNVVQFLDYEVKKIIYQFEGITSAQTKVETLDKIPQVRVNEASGVSYTGNHPYVIYYWSDSNVYLYDGRMKFNKSTQLFNLRSSLTSLSFSDQESFKSSTQRFLNEYLSCFKVSDNPLHYYLGTSTRIFQMDVRVPQNPIMKLSHGMVSPAAFMDVYRCENYEVVAAASQRTPETFCAIFDHTHIACIERPECSKRNPILYCYPKHLYNPREYFEYTHEIGISFGWESDFQSAKNHCYAWTTGISLMPHVDLQNPKLPSPFTFFQGNSFGDVFVQEWEQKPTNPSRKVESNDERLTSFVTQWRDSMQSSLAKDFESRQIPTHSNESADCSLLIETCSYDLKHTKLIRTKPFDPVTPHSIVFNRVRDGLPSLEEQVRTLRGLKSDRIQDFLNVWVEDSEEQVEDEINENEMNNEVEGNDNEFFILPSQMASQLEQIKEEVAETFDADLSDTEVMIYEDNDDDTELPGSSRKSFTELDLTQPKRKLSMESSNIASDEEIDQPDLLRLASRKMSEENLELNYKSHSQLKDNSDSDDSVNIHNIARERRSEATRKVVRPVRKRSRGGFH